MKTLTVGILGAFALSLEAATVTWTGASSTDNTAWGDPANWSGGAVPTAEDAVTISSGLPTGKVIYLGANRAVKSLTVSAATTVDGGAQFAVTVAGGVIAAQNATLTLKTDILMTGNVSVSPSGNNGRVLVYGKVSDGGADCDLKVTGVYGSDVRFYDEVSIGGTLTVDSMNFYLDDAGRIADAKEIVFHRSTSLQRGTGSTVCLGSKTGALNADRIADAIPVRITEAGITLKLSGSAAGDVVETLGTVTLESGLFEIQRANADDATRKTELHIANLIRKPGATMKGGAGFLCLDNAAGNDPSGVFAPWALADAGSWVKIDSNKKLVALAGADYTELAASANSPLAVAKHTTAETLTLAEDSEVRTLRNCNSGSGTRLDLGDKDLTVSSGAILNAGDAHPNVITSAGGRIVFTNDTLTLTTGKAAFTNEAAIAWIRPSAFSGGYPSLSVPCNGSIVFLNGNDEQCDWQDIVLSLNGDWNGTGGICFGGAANRTIHGSVYGSDMIRQIGSGRLTVKGDVVGMACYGVDNGELVFSSCTKLGSSVVQVGSGGRLLVAADCAASRSFSSASGAVVGGLGSFPAPSKTGLAAGTWFEPGLDGSLGKLTITGMWAIRSGFNLHVKVNESSNGCLSTVRLYYESASYVTGSNTNFTIRVSDPTRGRANLDGRSLLVFERTAEWLTDEAGFFPENYNFTIENGTPKYIDTSEAKITIKKVNTYGRRIYVEGLKSIRSGFTVLFK